MTRAMMISKIALMVTFAIVAQVCTVVKAMGEHPNHVESLHHEPVCASLAARSSSAVSDDKECIISESDLTVESLDTTYSSNDHNGWTTNTITHWILDIANAQIDWLEQEHGGEFAREMIQFQTVGANHNNTEQQQQDPPLLGVFALTNIPKDTVLMKIPRSSILDSESDSDAGCNLARNLLQHRMMGHQSEFAPYTNYLFSRNYDYRLPSHWSKAGKKLLKYIRGPRLPPSDLLTTKFASRCLNDEEEDIDVDLMQSEFAYATVISRATGDGKLVPLLDMFNHHSGPHCNVDSTAVNDASTSDDDDEDIVVFARRDIQQGEQLFINYMDNVDDYEHPFEYSLPHLLRDFGFVDSYPQRWIFPSGNPPLALRDLDLYPNSAIVFEVDEEVREMSTTGQTQKSYSVTWHTPNTPPKEEFVVQALRNEFNRIERLSRYVAAHIKLVARPEERDVISQFYRSIFTALKEAIQSITGESGLRGFDEVYDHMACEDFEVIWMENGPWNYVGEVVSHHQEIQIYHQPKEDDACLLLEDYLHACASNRPHYHEVFVHYPARYLDKVERVLYIGGGDSMVLHEVLKYKDLKKVVGLELDQQVVRTVFNRFGTQPHFDNDKVEWYFGDAAATLRILPREYYGTFDLVVVDILTSIAEMLKVTSEYSIMEAAMLLLHPNGIIIKNEDEGYKPGSSLNFTNHMVDLVYHDVPVYCLQTFVMGSNGVSFATKKPVDHGVSTLYLKGVDEFQSQFNTWYTTTDAVHFHENDNKALHRFEPLGLTTIIEAEKTRVSLESSIHTSFKISKILEHHGLTETGILPIATPLESSTQGFETGYAISFIRNEGVINARCFPAANYCAFDIQLWTAIHKSDAIKADLVITFESQQDSVYRLVTSGLKDVDSNLAMIGPQPKGDIKDAQPDESSSVPSSTYFSAMADPTVHWNNATLHSYDNRGALEQWSSQSVVGIQSMIQFMLDPTCPPTQAISRLFEELEKIFQVASLKGLAPSDLQILKHKLDHHENARVFFASWSRGNMVAVWNGESRFDVNLFSLPDSPEDLFYLENMFISQFRAWPLHVGESFPRGTGRVINFQSDYESRDAGERPFWA